MAFDPTKFAEGIVGQATGGGAGGFDIKRFTESRGVTPRANIDSSAGLYNLAVQSGLQKDADRLLAQKGEKVGRIFSGGWISDTFDVLNALQYGVVGLLKGMSFKEGMKTRQSFSDRDALGDFGIPGTVLGIILDIAVDPLTYIPPLAVAKRVPGLAKAAKNTTQLIGATKVGQWFGRKFVYRFGQDPVYKEMAERTTKNIGIGNQQALELTRGMTVLSPKVQKRVLDARKAGNLGKLPVELENVAKPAFDVIDDLGAQAVELGLLDKATYLANKGRYVPRKFRKFEEPGKKFLGVFPTKKRITQEPFLKRKDLPIEVREAYGEILEAGYPTAKSIALLNSAIQNAKFFKGAAKRFGSDEALEGFKQLSKINKSLGDLAGKWVPEPIFDDIQEITRVKSAAERGLGKIVGGFKFGKVVMNPGTHGRNIMSNFMLNSWEGLNPWRLDIYGEAAKQLKTKGKFFQEAKKVGLGLDTFAAQEIKDLLLTPEGFGAAGKFKKAWRGTVSKLSNIYQGEENFAKMAQYIFQRKKGLSPEKAWKVAERATFNYAQVTPFIRRLRESVLGFPFITFTTKVTPQVARTLARKPGKISVVGKIRKAIENRADIEELEKERANLPSYIRDGFYIKLPMKDSQGRSAYFDMTYLLPFGNLLDGQLFKRQINRETGIKESVIESVLDQTPFFQTISQISKNQDFLGNKIWQDSDSNQKQLQDLMLYLTKVYTPPLIGEQLPGGYRADGTRREPVFQRIADPKLQQRTLTQEIMRNVGLKIQPIDLDMQEGFMESEKRKALETLLIEKGKLREFRKKFVPKANPL